MVGLAGIIILASSVVLGMAHTAVAAGSLFTSQNGWRIFGA
jgi:hypothetical protein